MRLLAITLDCLEHRTCFLEGKRLRSVSVFARVCVCEYRLVAMSQLFYIEARVKLSFNKEIHLILTQVLSSSSMEA